MSEYTRKIALFKSPYGTLVEAGDYFDEHTDYVRISEYKEIEFTPLSQSAIIETQCEVLDKQEQSVMAEYENKLTDIRRRKSELLAITFNGES